MPIFTQVLKDILDRGVDIGLSKYPTPNVPGVTADEFRDALNGKIIRHYFNREIGLESTSLFRYNMETKMGEIMPFFVKLYETELIEFDPLSTMDIESTSKQDNKSSSKGNQKSKGDSSNESTSIHSTFPQQMIVNDNGQYADDRMQTNGSGDQSGEVDETRDASETGNSTSRTKGYSGSASALLTAYRGTLLNIDMDVIRQLEELFMQVWDTGDSYTGGM